MKISTLLDNIDLGAMALPEFQRGYVWNRNQVRGLMSSLYRRHPVGGLLVWVTQSDGAPARGDGSLQPGFVNLLLDGQQRITSLYGLIRGRPPRFFDGNANAFTGLHFDVREETFEFYWPLKMKDDPLWVDVSEVMVNGPNMPAISAGGVDGEHLQLYMQRLMNLAAIKDIELHVEQVTGSDKTVDVVVDIFNRVNSGGTKLSKGDLALARVCATWPEARDEMKARLGKWDSAGFPFRLDWLLRNVNAIVTGRAEFSALAGRPIEEVKDGLAAAEKNVDKCINQVGARLGLDHGTVLGASAAFPLMSRYVHDRAGKLEPNEWDRLMYWYVHAFLWGRYAGSTETVLNQDLSLIESVESGTDDLIAQLQQSRGDLTIRENDFIGWSRGARFYPLLYLLTRTHHARDWGTGLELRKHMLGAHAMLEVHHIFPKRILYDHGYSKSQVNSLANFTFLTKETNLEVTDREPAEYIEAYEQKKPGSVASHWMPMDPALRHPDRYLDFLADRRVLLAKAANEFLDSLLAGTSDAVDVPDQLSQAPARVALDDEGERLRACADWAKEIGLAQGILSYELADSAGGAQVAVLDVAWPDGLQAGLTEPVALLLDEPPEVEQAASRFGFRYFTDIGSFRQYVEAELFQDAGATESSLSAA